MKRLLLFDVDGTLIETRGAGRRALRAAMLEVLGEAGMIEGHEFRGKTDPAIVRELLRGAGWDDRRIDAEMPAVWGPYLRELEAALATSELRPSPCPGVRVLLERLSENDRYALGLLTGNVEEGPSASYAPRDWPGASPSARSGRTRSGEPIFRGWPRAAPLATWAASSALKTRS